MQQFSNFTGWYYNNYLLYTYSYTHALTSPNRFCCKYASFYAYKYMNYNFSYHMCINIIMSSFIKLLPFLLYSDQAVVEGCTVWISLQYYSSWWRLRSLLSLRSSASLYTAPGKTLNRGFLQSSQNNEASACTI